MIANSKSGKTVKILHTRPVTAMAFSLRLHLHDKTTRAGSVNGRVHLLEVCNGPVSEVPAGAYHSISPFAYRAGVRRKR